MEPAKLQKLCALAQDMMCICTFEGIFEYMNDAWRTCLGWELDEIRAKPFIELIHPDDVAKTLARFEQNLAGMPITPVMGFTNRYRTKAGGWRYLRWSTVTDMQEKLIYSSALDVTDTMMLIESLGQARANLDNMARSDELTGLLNRRGGKEILEREVARVHRFGDVAAICIMDIDYFKKINDSYSHQTGDAVLQAVANTLKNEARSIDTVIRWGGEEFLFVLPGVGEDGARQFAQRMLHAVAAAKHPLVGRITMSAGTAELRRGVTLVSAIATADARLYHAKNNGRNCVGRDVHVDKPKGDSNGP